jgi:integrase
MATKRGSGRHGSVRWRAERQKYEARLTLPHQLGRPSKYFDHEKEGWDWIARTYADALRGRLVMDDKRKTGQFLEQWLADVAPRTLKPNSLYSYRLCIGYVLPWIGDLKLKDLKRPHIDRTFNGLDAQRRPDGSRRYSRSILQLTHRVLKQALEYAADEEIIARNPMTKMKPLRLESPRRSALSAEDCKRLLVAAQGTRWLAAMWLLGTTGMRIGECLGLRWQDVDLETGRIRIEKQAQRFYGQPGVHLVDLKSEASHRMVTVPNITLRILRWHKAIQNQERLKAGPDWKGQGTVFCTPQGLLYYRSQFQEALNRFAKQEGIEGATPHTFRHTVSTLVQESGHTLKATQELLGHSSSTTTHRVYTHTSSDTMDRIADALQSIFGDANLDIPDPDDVIFDERGQTRGQEGSETSKTRSSKPKTDTTCPYSSVG